MMKKISIALFALSLAVISCKKESGPKAPVEKTVSFQPDDVKGKDAMISWHETNSAVAASNYSSGPNIDLYDWTVGGSEVKSRVVLSFPFDSIPAGAEIVSAKLSLYGASSSNAIPQGNSGDNKIIVQRISSEWTESTVNWANQPSVATEGQVELAASNSTWNFNHTDVDVTTLVKAMRSGGTSYGFMLRFVTESFYRSLVLGSSENSDPTKRPKLTVTYKQ
jgi:hypothetical protein